MRKSFLELMRYLFVPNTLLLGFRNVRDDYISRPIPHCRTIHRKDAAGFLAIKFRRCCRKSEWRLRYCVIYNKELFVYKDNTGRSEDIETCRIDLQHALEFAVSAKLSGYNEPAAPLNRSESLPTRKEKLVPICRITIVDGKRRIYELGTVNSNDAVYWTNSFYSTFFKMLGLPPNVNVQRSGVPKVAPRSYFRTTVEETRTYIVRSTLVMEKEVDDDIARKAMHERHYTASSTVAVNDELLSLPAGAPSGSDSKNFTPKSATPDFKVSGRKVAILSSPAFATSTKSPVMKLSPYKSLKGKKRYV